MKLKINKPLITNFSELKTGFSAKLQDSTEVQGEECVVQSSRRMSVFTNSV